MRTWMRTWSSSLIMTLTASSSRRITALCLTPLVCCGLMRWRSTRICRSSGLKEAMGTNCIRRRAGDFSTACRASSSTCWSCSSPTTAGKGTPAKLRARRMRLPRTTSRSGPLPFIHSLVGRLMISRSDIPLPSLSFAALLLHHFPLQGPQAVPQFRRPFVLLFRDGRVQFLPQAVHLPAAAQGVARPGRHLARMGGAAVDAAQHRLQLLVKGFVAHAAAQMPQPLKVSKGQPAVGAAHPGPGRRASGRHALEVQEASLELVEAESRLQPDGVAFLAGARLAQVRFPLFPVDDLRQMHRGFRLPAYVAQHRDRPPLTSSYAVLPGARAG